MGFEAEHIRGAYVFMVSGIRPDDDIVYVKFDTGAMNTVISINAIAGDKDAQDQVREYIEKTGIPKEVFRSASGHEMTGVRVNAENVRFGNFLVPSFNYYLVLDVDTNVALLGDDFIRYCKFSHMVEGAVIVDKVDFSMYQKITGSGLMQKDLCELLK